MLDRPKGRVIHPDKYFREKVLIPLSRLAASGLLLCPSLQLRHPSASLHATVWGTAEVAHQLMAGEVDLAVTFTAPRDLGLKIMHETRFEMGAVMRPDHPLAGRQEVCIDDPFDCPFIIADNSLAIRPIVKDMLERPRKPPIRTVTTNSVTMLKTLVAQGTGISILTKSTFSSKFAPAASVSGRLQVRACSSCCLLRRETSRHLILRPASSRVSSARRWKVSARQNRDGARQSDTDRR